MAQIGSILISPPLINTSCAWASEFNQLRELYDCPYIGAITTRTATLNGFVEDGSQTVTFMKDSLSSLNSYGYSPNPLASYLSWVYALLTTPTAMGDSPSKPIIISITASTPEDLHEILTRIQALRDKLRDEHRSSSSKATVDPSTLLAIELNTSCPNIKDHPPAAYSFSTLSPLLEVFASFFARDHSFTIGLKLPPYLYSTLFDDVVRELEKYSVPSSAASAGPTANPFAFLTCTNTLGSSLLFPEQVEVAAPGAGDFALPIPHGGLAGEAIHALALGNIYAFSQRLASHLDPSLKSISLIGAGGVTSPEAVERMHAAGAKVVGCATVLGKEGVGVFRKLSGKDL